MESNLNSAEWNRPQLHSERSTTILVADDEPVNLSLVMRRLEREGYQVVGAQNGQEAIDITRQTLPDLVILDVMMPVVDGLQACRLLKADPLTRHIPVIFLSALDDTEAVVKGLSIGANDYISRPFKAEELIARVHVAIRLTRERDLLRLTAEEAMRRAEAALEMSISDGLTGLLNRYGLQRSLVRECAEARRYNRQLSCLMIDVDNFKTINDTYGHPTGDAALIRVALILTEAVRRSDVVCRYGGEEFLVLMPETELDGAGALAEKIRAAAAAHVFGDSAQVFSLTLSVGAAELHVDESGNDMVARADAALYHAKSHGGNRVEAESQN